ncbi:Serine protease, subtilisin family [Halobacillus karajensis]|uniref:Minor extracellular protease epr n=1 Tax=Halobacillus karajensis TaxID=195088 RepID=A0A059NYE3_9BACI|nr:S8 family serine peptidase [Halobacillus karajensis]CDQ18925.1 Minor extracellular protease epr precursor [Halobacillus karajensis]CDQ23002.1 Minor extracellular protease epr precursor [Halobacillus karajensis]CDQ26484.1 Minor extracellular protease epr precursor [Halobacillus karajensis]SEH44329.1 Serine protease, subtilisin family [Halobacillus karajensis]
MKQAIKTLTLGVTAFLIIAAGGVSAEEKEDLTRVIIGFDESMNHEILESVDIHYTYDEIPAVSASISKEEEKWLKAIPGIEWVEDDQKIKTSAQKETWGYESTKTPQSREWGLRGDGVKIAIIDTGIDPDHPDLDITKGVSVLDETESWSDDNGHGTHVAGVIAAEDNDIGVVGVAPDADIYAVKALNKEGDGWESEIIAGIEWAIKEKVDIINLSLTSCQPSTGMKNTLKEAEEAGISVVAASGNGVLCSGEYLNDVMYPARYESVISVGAVDEKNTRALFSYGGKSLDFVAPGTNIYSTYITTENDPDGYRSMNGTSMAAPYVSGVLALTMEAYPNTSKDKWHELLEQHTVDLGEEGKDYDYGHGLVQSLSKPFADITKKNWYYPYIQQLYKDEIVKGTKDGTFAPLGEITREEVVTMIGRSLGLDGTKRETSFPDVPASSFGSGYIASAVEEGWIKGLPDGTFAPKQKITRAEVAVMIHRVFDLPSEKQVSFPDVSEDCYCYDAVMAVGNAGVVTGFPDGTFGPEKNITRSELAAVLARSM